MSHWQTFLGAGATDRTVIILAFVMGVVGTLTMITLLPFLILAWPLLLFVGVVQLLGQGVIWSIWKLISWPFRHVKAPSNEPGTQQEVAPVNRAASMALLIGAGLGTVWAIYAHFDLYRGWF